MTPAQKMLSIFVGNPRAHGRDVPKGDDPAGGGMKVEQPLTERLMESHLRGDIGIGVYPSWHDADGELVCQWGACDIDTGDWQEAWGLATALRSMGMVPHIERSRSKGWHIFVFSDRLVTAAQMRRALKVAYAAIELPAKEANPKSEQLKPGQLGNYLRLPYKGALKGGLPLRQTFMSGWDRQGDGTPVQASDWLYEFDSSCQTQASVIVDWATRWREPTRKVIVDLDKLEDADLKQTINSLPGDLMLFVKNGPVNDRSAGMVALAHKLRATGYTAKEIYSIISVADQIWGGKYMNRTDGEKYLLDIVERCVQ